ncbi:non-reducing end alpha-L-arabinofuranosidase family hydrolase [Crateriforma conspicua]|uniref:non-reducing end alpha-L-arabinofuranosidase n=1 Tax=Crateriforma conspicua TaxID=2527996 RepID=A0A5C5Y532_9PLAN|nr:non-reducing end alpha-L-arabinofuranosidase family hydrolase [Crateriforma conspicua]TWT70019.1 Alpha-L-arabinofuranosidase C precursor [Crateriforma conspicua]
MIVASRIALAVLASVSFYQSLYAGDPVDGSWNDGRFHWHVGKPILSVDQDLLPDLPDHRWVAVKDPSVVRHDGHWHLFCTLRNDKKGDGRIRIGYLKFSQWEQAKSSEWSVLDLTLDYHGAPQIFYFRPDQKWYLIYQAADESRNLRYGPCYSVNDDINNPTGWSRPEPLYVVPEGKKAGLDFWVICDNDHAYLFFTSLNGKFWRSRTRLDQFPDRGWSEPVIALQADIYEASHTYHIKGLEKYVTLVEAQDGKRRYFKTFIADTLDGTWRPLAASRQKPFVAPKNVINQSTSWATSYSHGEFIRDGIDQRLSISDDRLTLLFQGASDTEYQRGSYGDIPWRLGLLRLADEPYDAPE